MYCLFCRAVIVMFVINILGCQSTVNNQAVDKRVNLRTNNGPEIKSAGNVQNVNLLELTVDNSYDTCSEKLIRKSLDEDSIGKIVADFKSTIYHNRDSCTLFYIDVAFENYKRNATGRTYSVISSMSCLFDGYISEYVIDKLDNIFDEPKREDEFLRQLYAESKDDYKSQCLYEFIKMYLQVYNHNFINAMKKRDFDDQYNKFLKRLISDQ